VHFWSLSDSHDYQVRVKVSCAMGLFMGFMSIVGTVFCLIDWEIDDKVEHISKTNIECQMMEH